ncbi:MAG: MaoC family dehydratase [Gammaproteobacteria bacterium]|nr:MaoC family dehydratase [Gammaproteobacteria bacterium]
MTNPGELKQASKLINTAAIAQYAAITDDYNPIHMDAEFAAKTEMGGIIAHGMLSLNLIWQALSATFGPDVVTRTVLDVRFTKPVRVDDVVTGGGSLREGTSGDYDVWVKNQNGETVIKGSAVID